MAYCEQCGSKGHDPATLVVDPLRKILLGPCCAKGQVQSFNPQEVNWGLEVSSHYGVKAYVEYGGFSVAFRKTPEEIQRWLGQTPNSPEQMEFQFQTSTTSGTS